MSADRPTPITDAARMTERNGCVTTFQGHEVVKADHSRQLELQCQELAEALKMEDELNAGCECDHCKNTAHALSNWAKLQEGMKQ